MIRTLRVLCGSSVCAVLLARIGTTAGLIGGNHGKTVDPGEPVPPWLAAVIDFGLEMAFGVHHSIDAQNQ